MLALTKNGRRNTHAGDGQPEDSYLVFASWLITRTKEGNLGWDGQAHLISAQLRSMVAEFTTYSSRTGRPEWSVFTVRDAHAELMRVSPLVLDRSPLALALDDLFAVIIKFARPSSFWRRLHSAWLLRIPEAVDRSALVAMESSLEVWFRG